MLTSIRSFTEAALIVYCIKRWQQGSYVPNLSGSRHVAVHKTFRSGKKGLANLKAGAEAT